MLAFPTELTDKYPRIFINLTWILDSRISILRIVLAIIFREFCEYAKETCAENGCEIAMAHCRSFPGFQMMELVRGEWRYWGPWA